MDLDFNLSLLSNEELTAALEKLTGDERATTLAVLYYLTELESRGLFREQGYSSLFDYCTRKLKYSESSAYRRIAGARCIAQKPELAQLFLDGKVTLCTIALAAKSIKTDATKVEEIIGKSKREVASLVALTEPVASKPREQIRAVYVEPGKTPLLSTAPQDERYELRFTVSKETYQQIESAKARLSTKLGRTLTLEAVFARLVQDYLKPSTRTSKNTISDTRYIPQSVRRAVQKRDGGCCAFVAPDGTRCAEQKYLQFDHIVPHACGGKSEINNLRLLCPAHNQLMAEQVFGRAYIQEQMGV